MSFKRLNIIFLAVMLIVLLVQPFQINAQIPKPSHLTFESVGSDDLRIVGMNGSANIFVPFQSNWEFLQDVPLNVIYTASPLLNQTRSTLSVVANDQTIYSLRPIGDGKEHSFSVIIPAALLSSSKSVLVRFVGFLKLTTSDCEETNNPGQWLTISKRSEFALTTQENRSAPSLENLSRELIVRRLLDPVPPIVFVLPEKWNDAILTTAARIASRLGQRAGGVLPEFQVVTVSGLTQDLKANSNLIAINTSSAVLPPDTAPSATATQAGIPPSTAISTPSSSQPTGSYIKISNSPWNPARRILVINAINDDELAEIGRVFSNSDRFALLNGPATTLASLTPKPIQRDQPLPWTSDVTTFAQLGFSDRNITGSGVISEYYGSLRLPPGWLLEPSAKLTLMVAFSPALQTEKSYLTLLANSIFIGNVPASNKGDIIQATFKLLGDQLQVQPSGKRTQQVSLQLSVANNMTLTQCEQTEADSAWVRINATSFITTSHRYMVWPDLAAFPYPFLQDTGTIPLVVALPANPSNSDLRDGLLLAAALGAYSTSDFDLALVSAGSVSEQKYADANLIILGTRNNQPLLATFEATLPSFPDSDIVAALKNPDFGILREDVSPWNRQRAILMVFSASSYGYKNAFDTVVNDPPPVVQSGSLAVVETGQPPRVVYRAVTPTATPTPAGTAAIEQTAQAISTEAPVGTSAAK